MAETMEKKIVTYTFPAVVFLKARNVSGDLTCESEWKQKSATLEISVVGGWAFAKLQFFQLSRSQETRNSKI
jgi:hypothetical protein